MKNEFVVVNSKKLTAVTFTPINFRGLDMTYFDSKDYAEEMCVFANKKDTKSTYVVMTVEDWKRVSA
jgi:hypothetical protein